jgi:hypothetical protein
MEIDIRKITEQLLIELQMESDKMKFRAEGVSLLYERIRKAAENTQPAIEETREEQTNPTGE